MEPQLTAVTKEGFYVDDEGPFTVVEVMERIPGLTLLTDKEGKGMGFLVKEK